MSELSKISEFPCETREERIDCFLDRVWPIYHEEVCAALDEVLRRLDDDTFEFIDDTVSVAIQLNDAWAFNLPRSPVNQDVVIVNYRALQLSHKQLVGLLAHELCHSLVHGMDDSRDEEAANQKARELGFGLELDELNQRHTLLQ